MLTITLMMIGTAIIAVAPTYASIGLAAPVLIVVARMMQGFSAGGEFGSARAFLAEQNPERRGFFTSWQFASQGITTVLATAFGATLTGILTLEPRGRSMYISFHSRLTLIIAICSISTLPAQAQSISLPAPGAPVVWDDSTRPVWLTAWLGAGVTNSFVGGYVGGTAAVNGNLWIDGVVFRVDFLGGKYWYPSAGSKINVWMSGGDVLVGYRTKIGNGLLTGLIGPAYQQHDNPDPTAAVRGTEFGVMGHLELDTWLNDSLKFHGVARYATPFSTFSATGRLKYRAFEDERVLVGPEASYLSNENNREAQLGAAVSFEMPAGEIRLSAGYLKHLTPGPDGYYVNIYLGRDFR